MASLLDSEWQYPDDVCQPESNHPQEPNSMWGEAWRPTEWAAIDAGNAPKPVELARRDGARLLYGGRRWNVLHGQPDSGKTWIALFAVAQFLKRCANGLEDRSVILLDYEDGPEVLLANLTALGVDESLVRRWVVHYSVTETVLCHGRISDSLERKLSAAGFVVLDSALASAETEGLSPTDPAQVSAWRQAVMVPIERSAHPEATLLLIDHDPMGSVNSRRQPIGGQAKYRAVKGVQMRAVIDKQPVRGRPGRINLFVTKDNLSRVSEVSEPATVGRKGGYWAGVFVMNPTDEGTINAFIAEPSQAITESGAGAIAEVVMAATERRNADGVGMSGNQAEAEVREQGLAITSGDGKTILERLVRDGRLRLGPGRGGHPGYWLSDTTVNEEDAKRE